MLTLFQGVMGASKDPRYSRLGLPSPDSTEFILYKFDTGDEFVFIDRFGAYPAAEVMLDANGTLFEFRIQVAFTVDRCTAEYDLRISLPRSIGSGNLKCGTFQIGEQGKLMGAEDVVFCAPARTLLQAAGVAGMMRLMSSNQPK